LNFLYSCQTVQKTQALEQRIKELERERDTAIRSRDKAVEEALRQQRAQSQGAPPSPVSPRADMSPRGGDSRRSLTPVKSPRTHVDPNTQMVGIGILIRQFKPAEVGSCTTREWRDYVATRE
jgi:hypothetical protein